MSITQSCCKEIDYGFKSRRHCNHDLSKVKECLEHVCKLTSSNLEGIVFILNVGKLRFKIMIIPAHSQLISDAWETVPYNCLIPNLQFFFFLQYPGLNPVGTLEAGLIWVTYLPKK